MYIVRYSEIGLKGTKARERMEQLLVRNISKGLGELSVEATIKRGFGRIYITGETDSDRAADVLSRTMGVKNYSRAIHSRFTRLEDITSKAVELWADKVNGKSFAVRARRTGQHDFSSRDIMRAVGDAVYPYAGRVNLVNPDVEINVEVRENSAYYFGEYSPGPGGLPLGSEGKLVALVSGGIDSPVAAWSVMKRGCPTDLIFCSLAHPVDTRDFLIAAKALNDNWGHGYDPKIHIINGSKLVGELTDRSKFKLANITFKRILYLLAERIAKKSKAHGIVTGESLGQVSSQTPESLHATSHNLEVPVMRPMLGFDKDDIVALSRKIGTFPESSKGEFCSLFAAHPITRPTISELEEDMKNFDFLEHLIGNDTVIRGSEIADFLSSLGESDVEASEVPMNSIVVDLRSKDKYEQWHFPGAVNMDLQAVDQLFSSRDGNTYIFYCMKGLQSAYAASRARAMGTTAYFISEDKLRKKVEA
ncbi:hypothetical protein IX51_09865 [uncultured archaeon]|nr:hypothetical protein IX51_09865 [uncultured archaeon]